MPRALTGPWPQEILEALAYHEMGHAMTAVHYGLLINWVWIADGKARAPHVHREPGVEGEVASASHVERGDLETLGEHMLAQVVSGCAPEASEKLNPRYKEYKERPPEDPFNIFMPSSGLSRGSINDVRTAFRMILPVYTVLGLSQFDSTRAFQRFFRMPTHKLMTMYKPQIEALVPQLVEKRFMTGHEVHAAICAAGHGTVECHDHVHLPGCTCDGDLDPELVTQLGEVQKEFAKQSELSSLLDAIGGLGMTGTPGSFGASLTNPG
jgi:hypothetical protein